MDLFNKDRLTKINVDGRLTDTIKLSDDFFYEIDKDVLKIFSDVGTEWHHPESPYRYAVLIDSPDDLNDFQINLKDIYTNDVLSPRNDLFVYDYNGNQLNHWVKPGEEFWIKTSLKKGLNIIFVYYGSGIENIGDGNQVFEFFDDFEGDSLDSRWSSNRQVSVSNSSVELQFDDTEGDTRILTTYNPLPSSIIGFGGICILESPSYRNRLYFGKYQNGFQPCFLDDPNMNGNKDYGLYYRDQEPCEIFIDGYRNVGLSLDCRYTINFKLHDSKVDAYYYNITTNTQIYSITNLIPSIPINEINLLMLCATEQESSHFSVDYIYVGKYTYPEPSIILYKRQDR